MSAEATTWYSTKVDWWLAIPLALGPLVSTGACVAIILSGNTEQLAIGMGSVCFIAAIYLGLVFPMRYGIDDTQLIVRFGLCRNRVPLKDISEVSPTRNPLSSPALSLDRLRVQFGSGFGKAVMISPKDRDQFLHELSQRAGLMRDGERLIRMGTFERHVT